MNEPIFLHKDFQSPETFYASILAAVVLGCLCLVKRPDDDDKWWEAEQRHWDRDFTDPATRWDGFEYRPTDIYTESKKDIGYRPILDPSDL